MEEENSFNAPLEESANSFKTGSAVSDAELGLSKREKLVYKMKNCLDADMVEELFYYLN